MDGKLTYNFQKNRKLLMILSGMEFVKHPRSSRILNKVYLTIFSAVLVGLLQLAIEAVINANSNISLILEASQFIVSLMIIILGFLNALYHRQDLTRAANQNDEGIFHYHEELTEKMKLIKETGINEIRVMVKIFTIYITFSGVSYLIASPLKQLISSNDNIELNKLLPLPLFQPFDTTSITGFTWALSTNLLCMYSIIVLILSIDEVFISLMIQIRVQYQLLNCSLETLTIRAVKRMNISKEVSVNFKSGTDEYQIYKNEEFKRALYICLQENIKHHHQLIRFIKLVEPYLGTTFIIIVALSSLIIATTGFLAIMYNNTTEELLKFCIVLLSELIFVLHFCWFGEDVTSESEKVHLTLYRIEWYKSDKKFNKLIEIMMVNCKRPFRLYSNHYKVPASLETFYLIMSRSYTYLNLLRHQRKRTF